MVDEVRTYIVGEGRMPAWCRKAVDAYKKIDGSTGYELRTHKKNVNLNIGDKVIRENGLFKVERKAKNYEG